jgi:hypothetical protein
MDDGTIPYCREQKPLTREIRTDLQIEAMPLTESLTFGKTVCAGFGMPERLAPWPAALVGREGWHKFVAKDGDAVAAAALYVRKDIAWLGMRATRPARSTWCSDGPPDC